MFPSFERVFRGGSLQLDNIFYNSYLRPFFFFYFNIWRLCRKITILANTDDETKKMLCHTKKNWLNSNNIYFYNLEIRR